MERQTLGPFELIRLLGRGGMGEVWLARDPRLNREVALKILPRELAANPERRERLLREARAAAALNHPNICTIHEIGTADGVDYIALEYIAGQTLEQMAGRGGLPLERLLEIALPLAEALAHAHGTGIVHRDLKPANVMVSGLGIPKILDFGLAKVLEPAGASEAATRTRLTDAGVVVGTTAFMAPEQALGREVDQRSDIFSFGSLLYELATGRPAFSGSTTTEVLDAVLHREPVAVDRLRPDLPAAFGQIIAKAVRKDPAERYQHMSDLAADLRHLKRQSGATAEAARVAPQPSRRSGRRVAAITTGVLLLVVIGALAAYQWQRSQAVAPAPGSLAVMYFENLADRADRDSLSRMLTSLLVTELSRSPDLQVVSSQRLYDVARQLGHGDAPVDRSVATEVAKRAAASSMLLGQVARAGERLVVTTELVEVASGRLLGSQKTEGRSADDIFAIAEALGEQVRRALPRPSSLQAAGDLAAQLTSSVEAYRAYVRGDVLFHRFDLDGAAEQYREAVRIDPQFALAYYRLSWATGWRGKESDSREAAGRAAGLLDRVPASYRDVIEANSLYVAGRYSEALPLVESILTAQPDNREALYMLSEFLIHSDRYANATRAAELLENLLSVAPDLHIVFYELSYVYAYALQGERQRAREILDAWEAKQPAQVQELRAFLAAIDGRFDEALRLLPSAGPFFTPYWRPEFAMLAERWQVAEKLVREELGEGFWRAWALRNRATFHAYTGAFDRAADTYRQAAGATRVEEGDESWVTGTPAAALHSLADLLAVRGDHGGAQREAERALAARPKSPRCLYVAGVSALRAGRPAEADRHLATLRETVGGSAGPSAAIYRDGLEAEIALARGNPGDARALFERATTSGMLLWDQAAYFSSAGASFRDGLARAYLALGDRVKAAQALEGLITSGYERVHQPVLYVRALYTLGTLKLELGDRAAGEKLLRQFLEHWGRADWDLPEVRDARKRLGRG